MHDLKQVAQECSIKKIAYDAWHAQQLIAELEKEMPAQTELIEFKQNLASFSEPAKLFEKSVLDKKIIDTNPVMLWCLGNVVVKPDANGNIKPLKKTNGSKIDIVITSIMAHYLLISDSENKQIKYTGQDLLNAL